MNWIHLGRAAILTIIATGILQNGICTPVNSFGLMSTRKTQENGKSLKMDSADLPREKKLTAESPERSLHEHELEDIEKDGSLTKRILEKIYESDTGTDPKSVVLQKRLVYGRDGDTNAYPMPGAAGNHVHEQPGSKILQQRLMNNNNGLKALLSLRDRVKLLHEKIDNAIDTYDSSEKNSSPLRILSSFRETKKIPPALPPALGDFRASYNEEKAASEQEGFDWLKQGHQVTEDLPDSRPLTSNDESPEQNLAELQARKWEKMQDAELPKIGETSLKKAINVDVKRQPLRVQTDNRAGERDAMKQPLDTFIHTA